MAPRITAMTVKDGRDCAILYMANIDRFIGYTLRGNQRNSILFNGIEYLHSVTASSVLMCASMLSMPVW